VHFSSRPWGTNPLANPCDKVHALFLAGPLLARKSLMPMSFWRGDPCPFTAIKAASYKKIIKFTEGMGQESVECLQKIEKIF
jgi:hypothetical protein